MEGGIAPGPRHRSSTSPSSAGATAAIQLPAVVTASSTATPPSTTVRLPVVPLAATPASSSKARLSLAQVLLTRLAASSILLLLFVTLRSWLSDYPEYGKPRLAPHSPSVRGCRDGFLEAKNPREKAAILILARDDDLGSLLPTIDNFEAKFNGRFQYPYVFLNNEPFSDDFVSKVRQALPKGRKTEFGLIGKEMWSVPEWIGEQKAEAAFKQQEENRVQYAGRAGYHHMCRFYSGLFARHPLLAKYDWYWRLEPGVRYFCDVTYDPFRFLAERDMYYGFVITIVETPNTIPTLFQTMLDYRNQTLGSQPRSDLWQFFLKSGQTREEYNLCHFWTNMEIGSLKFFRSKAYQDLFDHLDRKGGFYLERWGDAPIRSLALGMLADFDKVHYFEDLAYKHDWFVHCPRPDSGYGCNCDCPKFGDGNTDIDTNEWYSCLPRWRELDKAW